MEAWCMEHYWMTFFIAMSAVGIPRYVAYAVLHRRRGKAVAP